MGQKDAVILRFILLLENTDTTDHRQPTIDTTDFLGTSEKASFFLTFTSILLRMQPKHFFKCDHVT